MNIPNSELFPVLQEFNPWWAGLSPGDLPSWERGAIHRVTAWVADTATKRSLLLTGARQVGKTTLFRQAIKRLLDDGYPPGNILYATFDHPLLKLSGLEKTVRAWEDLYPREPGRPALLFLDEVQHVPGWETWIKHQVDFQRGHRVAATGSASPLRGGVAESGVGRWETITLPTLTFAEYLRLRRIDAAPPPASSMREMFDWTPADFARAAEAARGLTPHFHEYLIRGGFPEPALADDLARCQRLLREDIVEKVLKRDMTSLYGVRRVLEVEKLFLYLCYHDGGVLDLTAVTSELGGVGKALVANFIDLFEATHLIYRLKSYGYGKEVLRGRDKVYLADAALPGAVMLLGRKLLEQPQRLGAAVETAFFKHVFNAYNPEGARYSYWQYPGDKAHEVDVIAEIGGRVVPFEVKYYDAPVGDGRLKGLRLFLETKGVAKGYVICRRWEDFGVEQPMSALGRPGLDGAKPIDARIVRIPASLACYILSAGR